MVTERDPRKRFLAPFEIFSLKPPCLSVEELEQRLEASLMHLLHPEPCDCLGALCQCDGQDCIGVCEAHCLIHYG